MIRSIYVGGLPSRLEFRIPAAKHHIAVSRGGLVFGRREDRTAATTHRDDVEDWPQSLGMPTPTSGPVGLSGCLPFCLILLDIASDSRHNVYVRVISLKRLREFWERHADAEETLRAWYRVVLGAEWTHLQNVRATYPHADGLETDNGETLTVFNIGGNKYRLVARIRYDYQLVNIRIVLTHAEYNKGKWKE